jgi:hypothetical protein
MSTPTKAPGAWFWIRGLLILFVAFHAIVTLNELIWNTRLVLIPLALHVWSAVLCFSTFFISVVLGDRVTKLGTLRILHRPSRRFLGLPAWRWWVISLAVALLLARVSDALENLSPGLITALLIGLVGAIHLTMACLTILACWRTFVATGDDLAPILIAEGVCPNCRYPGGHLNTCPECGHSAAPIVIKTSQP